MITLDVHVSGGSYPIVIGNGILERLPELMADHCPAGTVAVVSDDTVAALYGGRVRALLEEAGITVRDYRFPAGEASKNSRQLNELHTWLIESEIRRDDCIIALGGGVTGDLAGFAAATYLRGVPVIQIPTTLLAMVDSGVGGKTGINHPLGKNLIGAFCHPGFVLVDPSLLPTLPPREIVSGLAETVKYGLITDVPLFEFLEKRLESIRALEDMDAAAYVIQRCCELKADIVRVDEREKGLRRILNFGHTLGHALEAETGYGTYRHGEAIVWGMRWACWISRQRGYIGGDIFQRIETLLGSIPVPPLPADLSAAALAEKMRHDKKQSSAGISLVLLTEIGRPRIETTADLTDLIKRWHAYVTT